DDARRQHDPPADFRAGTRQVSTHDHWHFLRHGHHGYPGQDNAQEDAEITPGFQKLSHRVLREGLMLYLALWEIDRSLPSEIRVSRGRKPAVVNRSVNSIANRGLRPQLAVQKISTELS